MRSIRHEEEIYRWNFGSGNNSKDAEPNGLKLLFIVMSGAIKSRNLNEGLYYYWMNIFKQFNNLRVFYFMFNNNNNHFEVKASLSPAHVMLYTPTRVPRKRPKHTKNIYNHQGVIIIMSLSTKY